MNSNRPSFEDMREASDLRRKEAKERGEATHAWDGTYAQAWNEGYRAGLADARVRSTS